ncbi:MAG: glycoprotein [Wufeng bat tupavirus 2]|nr:MAG: glycoprotein [Wufeng bat tupavirus 2]
MDIFRITLLVTMIAPTLPAVYKVFQVNLPSEEPKNWRNATQDDFSCSHSPEWDPDNPYVIWNVYTLGYSEHIEIPGYFCFRNIWRTNCHTNLIMSKDVGHQVTHSPVTVEECREELKRMKSGSSPIEKFPDPTCAWLSSVETTSSYIHLTPHSVSADPHTSQLVSPSFVGGLCNNLDYCLTIHPDRIWIPEEPITVEKMPYAFERIMVRVTLDPSEPAQPLSGESIAFSPRFAPVRLRGSCAKKMFDKPGILLTNGVWIGSPPLTSRLYYHERASKHNVQLSEWLEQGKLRFCGEEKEIRIPKSDYLFHYMQISVLHIMMYQFCMDSLEKVRSQLPITRLDLSRFAPRNPGLGKVFLLTPEGIKVGYARYEMSEMDFNKAEQDVLGRSHGPDADEWSRPIVWKTWPITSDGYKNGPNGIYMKGNVLIHPDSFFHEEVNDLDILIEHDITILPHVMVETFSNFTGDLRVESTDDKTTVHLYSGVYPIWSGIHWFGSIGDKIILIAILLISTVITIWISCLCLPRRKRRTW